MSNFWGAVQFSDDLFPSLHQVRFKRGMGKAAKSARIGLGNRRFGDRPFETVNRLHSAPSCSVRLPVRTVFEWNT